MEISQKITGIILLISGISLLILGLFIWPALIYAIPITIIGILILIDIGKERKIETIKYKKR